MRTRISRTGFLERVPAVARHALGQMADAVGEDIRAVGDGVLGQHGELGVGLQAGHDAAAGAIEPGPPAVIVIAEVEHVSGVRLDRHGLGGRDVVDVGCCDGGIDRAIGIGIVDDVHLGAADAARELRPVLAERAQTKPAGVDEMHGFAGFALETARGLADQMRKQAAEHLPRPLRVGVRQRRTRHLFGPEMIELGGVAHQRGFDLAQALRARQLRINQCDQLALRRQRPHVFVGTVLIHKPIEAMPGQLLQYPVKHAILVQHGVVPFRVLTVGKTSKHRRIHAMRLVYQN
jgi:hypothetical protein